MTEPTLKGRRRKVKDRTDRRQHNWSRENRGRESGGTRTGRRNDRHGNGERGKKDEREEKRGGQEVARGVGGFLIKVTTIELQP